MNAPPRRPDPIDRNANLVLLVEDDPQASALLQAGLRHMGFRTEVVDSAEEALEHLERGGRFGLLLTDVVLRGEMSGIDLAETALKRWPALAVICTSGYSSPDIRNPATRVSEGHFLPKPFHFEELERLIQSAQARALERNPV